MYDELNSDVSTEAAHQFFRERDPALEKAVLGMESVESWTRDGTEPVQVTLQRLADRVEMIDMQDLDPELHNKLIVMLGYISSGKAIKLLMWIEQSSPNFVAKTLAEAQMLAVLDKVNEGAARLFVERFEVLERLHLLSSIFAEERLEIVQRVLRILAGKESGDPDQDYGDPHENA